jgi:hypothetical protein
MDRERQAHEAADAMIAAIASSDHAYIASALVPPAQQYLIGRAHTLYGDATSIEDAVRLIYNPMMSKFFAEVSVETVTLDNGVATVTYVHATLGRDDDDVFLLREVDGRWLVDVTEADYADPD